MFFRNIVRVIVNCKGLLRFDSPQLYYSYKISCISKSVMSQRSITSFFQSKTKSTANVDSSKARSNVNAAVVESNKRKLSESDEEINRNLAINGRRKRVSRLPNSESEEEIEELNTSKLLENQGDTKNEPNKNDISPFQLQNTDNTKAANKIANSDELNDNSSTNQLNNTIDESENISPVSEKLEKNKKTPISKKEKQPTNSVKKVKSTNKNNSVENDLSKQSEKKGNLILKKDKKNKNNEHKDNPEKKTKYVSNKSDSSENDIESSPVLKTNKKDNPCSTKKMNKSILSKTKGRNKKEIGGKSSSSDNTSEHDDSNSSQSRSSSPESYIRKHEETASDKSKSYSSCSEEENNDPSPKTSKTVNKNVKKVNIKKTSLQKTAIKTANSESSTSSYCPNKSNYHPIDDAIWKHGEAVPYLALAETFVKIEEVSARLEIIKTLSNYFRSVITLSPEDLLPSIYLCLNKLAPVYEGIELGVADTYLMKAIAQCTGRNLKQIKSDFDKTGDLGIIAENSRSNQKMMFQVAPLTVPNTFKKLKEIAMLKGHAVMSKKVDKIQGLFVACKPSEARYVIRSLAGKLRIGLAEQSVLQALATACADTPPEQKYPLESLNVSKTMSAVDYKKMVDEYSLILKTTYCECPNYDLIIPVLLKEGITALPEQCKLTPGIPLKPMLAQPTKCIDDVFRQFDGSNFTCEWKYDGERAQIHVCDDGTIKIYSRNMEDNTSKYPDVISKLRMALKPEVKSCIIDAETVAWDISKKSIRPFQILSTRKRKNASEEDILVQVHLFVFDILYLNGDSLVGTTLVERRKLLKDNFLEVEDKFSFVTYLDANTLEEVQEFLEESVKGNCEGLMVKSLHKDAEYKIAKRSRSWLKLKKDYLQGVGDTLDLVVLGGYFGKGKRTGLYGAFLLACYDPDTEQYQSICKIGTGFTDDILAIHAEFFKQHIIEQPRSYYQYHDSLKPDHWFDAVQVWEIKCADLSLSPVYTAGIGIIDAEKGISLRFPRFIHIRTDKCVEDATTAYQVAEFYKSQDQIKNQDQTKNSKLNEDFY